MTRGAPTVDVLTSAEAEAGQRRAAGSLLARGCRSGDRVVFSLGSSADLICAVLGAARVGLIPVLLNATLTESERDRLVADAEPTVQILTGAALAALMEGTPAELAPYPLTRPMHYTSGTTGRPKGVTTGIWSEETARAVFEDEAAVWQFDRNDLHMVCSPMYHTVSVRFATGTLLSGGSLAILSRFDAPTALRVLRRQRPTTAFLVPTHLQRILQSPELDPDERFDSLRFLAHAGAPCPPSVKRATMARVGAGALWEFYGSTEGQFTVCGPEEWLAHPGTVGRARPGRRLSIAPLVDADADAHAEVAYDTDADDGSGTIWCDLPDFARFRYWGDDGATAAAWRGSACTVGDLGRLSDDGYLYLSGRRHDLIISGGVNVYPAEVEAALAAVPGLVQLAVFGQPDPQWGQKVCVAYVADRGFDEDALRAAAAAQLAPYKRPKAYFATSELPHTATGKLLRRALPEHLGLSARSDPEHD
ncbi:MAG TPA: AMP-binding protein [Acidimicrobiales bacterium]|nr:AMP-binding protein [Acidimicrobiales bacterium]